MPKTSIDLTRLSLSGAVMGTRWSARLAVPPGFDAARLQRDLQAAVDQVDRQMSTWRADSDLMRLDAAPVGAWIDLPAGLMTVLACALDIGRLTGGAFDIGVGDAVAAWGFGAAQAEPDRIRAARTRQRLPTHLVLDLDPINDRARKSAAVSLDLSGIAKGYGVDQLTEAMQAAGLSAGLLALDGEVRALGTGPDGAGWPVAVERPEIGRRAIWSMLALQDVAVATSGDYRHHLRVGDRMLSHTIDPRTGAPLLASPASVSVLAATCMMADALATALMVMGGVAGPAFARDHGIDALFLLRDGDAVRQVPVGRVFGGL